MEATDEAPRRRGIERTSSTTSIPPQITSRRDSLFGNIVMPDDDYYGYQEGDVVLSTANLYPPSTPRRRFHRRNGLCQFQMLQDAVHTTIDMNGFDHSSRNEERSSDGDPDECESNDPHSTEFHTPSTPSFSSSAVYSESFSSTSSWTRKVSLPMVHEVGAAACSDANYYFTGSFEESSSFASSRKLSRTCFRTNPSTGSIYTEESTL
mmetsp:Transcript_9193/g.17540  ORF Transcript_9193/g.17540 Transcript_9193/m.17540 type:complete len:208 (-) Transcript_9193:173-796(-)|eukprot:scaffold8271_cov171-Amphora_coffeaeformis.AAC.6